MTSKKMALTTWRESFAAFNAEIRAAPAPHVGAPIDEARAAHARTLTARRRNKPAFNDKILAALTTWRPTNPAFNRRIRGAPAHARSPPTLPPSAINQDADADTGADHDKGDPDMTSTILAAWHARREAELDAEEDRRLKPAPLAANATPAERTIHQNAKAYYQAKLDQRTERDRVRAELSANQAPFRVARDAEAQAKAEAEQTAQEAAQLARAEAHESHLRRRYLSQPGATPASWEADKTAVIQAERIHELQANATEQDKNRARVARNYE